MASLAFIGTILTANFVCGFSTNLVSNCAKDMRTLHEFTDKLLIGEEMVSFAENKNQIVIIANVASFWTYTVEQYHQLNALVEEFNTTRCPLRIFGVPCNQFGLQEPGVGIEIMHCVEYVRPGNGFKPNFDILVKRDVNGNNEDELYTWLKVWMRHYPELLCWRRAFARKLRLLAVDWYLSCVIAINDIPI